MTPKGLVRPLAALALAVAATFALVAPAVASPGAYKVLVVYNDDDPPQELQQQVAAEPGVATVDLFDAESAVPSSALLAPYDLVVDTPDDVYPDKVAYGDALAGFLDAGGVLVQFAYDSWESNSGEGAGPEGRFSSGGYAPFLVGDNPNDFLTLGSFDANNPLMQGVGPLTSGDNTEPELAPGATLVAKWDNDVNAIAYKGNVVSVSAYMGGEEIEGTGNYGRLAVNAVRWLGRQMLSVGNLNPAGGTVIGGGISCGSVCAVAVNHNGAVGLTATANPGFAFAGFGGSCAGSTCSLMMDVPKSVSANFFSFGTAPKVKRNKKRGTALFSFGVGGPGAVVLSGSRVKRRSANATKAGRVKLAIVPKGKALKQLRATGKAKVKVQVGFTPSGGSPAAFTKKIALRLFTSG